MTGMTGIRWSLLAVVVGMALVLALAACTKTTSTSTDGARTQGDGEQTASATPEEVVSSFMTSLATGSDEAVAAYGSTSLNAADVDTLLTEFPTLAEQQSWVIEPGDTSSSWFCVSESGGLAARLNVVGTDEPRISAMDVVDVVGFAETAREDLDGVMMDVYDNEGNMTQEPLDWLSVLEGQHRLAVRIRTNDSSIAVTSAEGDATSFDISGTGYDFVSVIEDGAEIADRAYSIGTGEDAGTIAEVEFYFAVPDGSAEGLSIRIEGYPDLALD